ncbi:MAG TPA: glycosyltransferase family 2 protein [Xanthobacteraceae bacterium]|nr:glycosyltransferase family 2 protein [Xanthobacteraceae bacterium]
MTAHRPLRDGRPTSEAPFGITPAMPARPALRTAFERTGERSFFGFVVDPGDPVRRFTVEILVDGYGVKVLRADCHVHQLAREQVGDGCYGFSLSLDAGVVGDSAVVEARLANLGTPVGAPIVLDQANETESDQDGPGAVRWLGGLRLSGWLGGSEQAATANVLVDGTLVTEARASGWSHVGTADNARAVRAFDLHLPQRFADGGAHQVAVVTERGQHLDGSPLPFLAFADGLRDALGGHESSGQEQLRAELFDRLMPMSVPFSRYQAWRQKFPIAPGRPVAMQAAVVMVGPGPMDDTLESLNAQTHDDWVAASLPDTSEAAGFRPELAQAFLETDAAQSDFVVFGLAGTVLAPAALQRIAGAFAAFERAVAVYGDVDLKGADGSTWPLAFPAFDYERMLAQGYCAHLFALRRPAAERCLAAGAANLYRLFNAVLDDGSASALDIVHLPGALGTLPAFDPAAASAALADASRAHCRQRGIAVQVTPGPGGVLPAVRVARAAKRSGITIVIPTRNRRHLLEACIDSILPAVERRGAEIMVVDNDSSDPDTLDYLADIDGRIAQVLRVPGDFNFPRLNNRAAEAATGDVLCLLNNDVEALDADWLDEMLGRIAAEDVGAVGAMLLWPSGVVQHGGVVLGPGFRAAHAFTDRIEDDAGYGDLLRVAHEVSAVTAACLVTRRRDYLDLGGMDEVRFPVNFNDVDYCLKLRARGQRIVFTPHARLLHLESASRGTDHQADRKARFQRELQNLRAKWGGVLAADPYYSPLLSLDPIPFSALAWPVRDMAARANAPPAPIDIPHGF